jgi:hypothetical protein
MANTSRAAHVSHALLFSAGMAAAFIIGQSGLVSHILQLSTAYLLLGAFIAGFFFTSLLTIVPSTVMFYGIFHGGAPLLPVALVGGLGAMLGDLLLFKILKVNLTDGLVAFVKAHTSRHIKRMWRFRWFSWAMLIAGAVVIASPLPDELGVALMGIGEIKPRVFLPLSFAMNTLGIVLVGLAAQSL